MNTPVVVLQLTINPNEQDIGPFETPAAAEKWCNYAMTHPAVLSCFVSEVDESAGDVDLMPPSAALPEGEY